MDWARLLPGEKSTEARMSRIISTRSCRTCSARSREGEIWLTWLNPIPPFKTMILHHDCLNVCRPYIADATMARRVGV